MCNFATVLAFLFCELFRELPFERIRISLLRASNPFEVYDGTFVECAGSGDLVHIALEVGRRNVADFIKKLTKVRMLMTVQEDEWRAFSVVLIVCCTTYDTKVRR